MTLFAVYNDNTLMAVFRNRLDAQWYLGMGINANVPLEIQEINSFELDGRYFVL